MNDVTDALEQHERTGRPKMPLLDAQGFQRITDDLMQQPLWRAEADRAFDYVDNNQFTPELLAELAERGMPAINENIIAPVVNAATGIEARQRLDARLVADDESHQDRVEVLSRDIKEAERETNADDRISHAYLGQFVAGIGWVEISREPDPRKYWMRLGNPHRNEMFWDMKARDPLIRDRTYLVRRRWYPTSQLVLFFPKFAEVFKGLRGGREDLWPFMLHDMTTERSSDMEIARGWTWEEMEWYDQTNDRTCMFEVETSHWVRGLVGTLPDGARHLFDKANPAHMEAYARGLMKVEPAVYEQRMGSMWAGPVRVSSYAMEDNESHYVPFIGYREDRTGVPYGPVRYMISPQDEVNARKQKLMWLLSAKRLFLEEGALDEEKNDEARVLQEIARPDALIRLRAGAIANSRIKVETDHQLAEQQFAILAENKRAAQEVSGIYAQVLGDGAGARSGAMVNSLVEQSVNGLGRLNGNYSASRREVFRIMAMKCARNRFGPRIQVAIGEGKRRRTVILNNPVHDPQTGVTLIDNDMRAIRFKVALADVPSTPAYRAQAAAMIAEVMKSLPPQAQMLLVPAWVESSDLADRKTLAKGLRRALNLPEFQEVPPEMEKEEMAAADQAAKAAAEIQQRGVLADIAKKEAEAALAAARAKSEEAKGANNEDLMLAKADADARMAEFQKAMDQVTKRFEEQIAKQKEEIQTLRGDAVARAAMHDAAKTGASGGSSGGEGGGNVRLVEAAFHGLEKKFREKEAADREEIKKLRDDMTKRIEEKAESMAMDSGEIEAWQRETAEMMQETVAKVGETLAAALADMKETLKAPETPAPPAKTITVEKVGDGKFIGKIVSADGTEKTVEVKK